MMLAATERAVLRALRTHPAAATRRPGDVKRAAGLSPAMPGFFGLLSRMEQRGLLRRVHLDGDTLMRFEPVPRRSTVAGCTTCELVQRIGHGPSHDPALSCSSGDMKHCDCSDCF